MRVCPVNWLVHVTWVSQTNYQVQQMQTSVTQLVITQHCFGTVVMGFGWLVYTVSKECWVPR